MFEVTVAWLLVGTDVVGFVVCCVFVNCRLLGCWVVPPVF